MTPLFWQKIKSLPFCCFIESYSKITQYKSIHCVKAVSIRSFSGPYFPAFGLNRERYGKSLRIQSECRKIRTRKTPNLNTLHTVISFWSSVNSAFFLYIDKVYLSHISKSLVLVKKQPNMNWFFHAGSPLYNTVLPAKEVVHGGKWTYYSGNVK